MVKVTRTECKPTFKPFSISIEFESQEEVDLFTAMMCRAKCTVPGELARRKQITDQQMDRLASLMNNISNRISV